MKKYNKKIKIHWTKILSIFFLFVLLGAYSNIFAIGQKYSPGEILDPECDPGEENCTVDLSEYDPIVGAINGLVKADGNGNISAVSSGTDIKTINGSSILGSGDIVISGSSPVTVVNSTNLFSTGLTGTGNGVTTTTNSNFLGPSAGNQATSASNSNFLGWYSGYFATMASNSNYIGYSTGFGAINASYSNFIGSSAGYQAVNAQNSIFIGQYSGLNDTVNNTANGLSSILIGSFTNTGGYSNSILLGSGMNGSPISNTKANQFMLAPTITEMRLRDVDYTLPSSQGGASTILTNDGSGGLSWSSPGSVSGSWTITGNAGTDGGATNFIGTTDDKSLTFKVNNNKGGYIGNTTDSNVSFGYRAGINATANKYLTAVGTYALENNTTGQANTGVGFSALRNNTTGYDNYALGHGAMAANTTGHSNMGMGSYALYRANGNDNTAVGNAALYWLTGTASGNTAIGFHSLFSATSAVQNVSIGWAASNNLTTGSNNTIVGYGTGFGIDTGSGNTIIGANVTGLSGSLMNNIILADGSGNIRINVNDSGNVQFSSYGAGTLNTDASGNITASSDERLKDIKGDFNNEGNALEVINSINPILYKWNDESGFDQRTIYAGFSAQNIKDLIPEAVGMDKNGYLTLSDRPILATAINAIKELDLKVKEFSLLDEISPVSIGTLISNFLEDQIVIIRELKTEILHIGGDVCVDDVCITKEEFKSMILKAKQDSQTGNDQVGSDNDTENNNSETINDNTTDSTITDNNLSNDPVNTNGEEQTDNPTTVDDNTNNTSSSESANATFD